MLHVLLNLCPFLIFFISWYNWPEQPWEVHLPYIYQDLNDKVLLWKGTLIMFLNVGTYSLCAAWWACMFTVMSVLEAGSQATVTWVISGHDVQIGGVCTWKLYSPEWSFHCNIFVMYVSWEKMSQTILWKKYSSSSVM